jgi:hypothetical protein
MMTMALLLGLLQVSRPLPDLHQFLQATKAELIIQLEEEELLKGYTYRRQTVRENRSGDGDLKGVDVLEHEIFQLDSGPYQKLVSRNGVPLSADELRKQDEARKKGAASTKGGPPFFPKTRTDRLEMIEDMFRVWDFQLFRRELHNGRLTIVIAFAPRKGAKPKTLAGKWMFKNAQGVAWIDEADHRLVRLRTVLIDDVSLAWGLFAKVHKGTEITREWQKVNDEVWLPSWSQKRLRARAFWVGVHFLEIEHYADYRKFDVETKLHFSSPNQDN